MKRCPSCNRTYTDLSLNFCLEDGTPLLIDPPPSDAPATMRYPPPRNTSEPPPTEIYRPDSPAMRSIPPPPPPPIWKPVQAEPKKSTAIWWVVGGVLVVGMVGVGLVVAIILLANMGTEANENLNNANNNRVANANANSNNANYANTNGNTNNSGAVLTDDFSQKKWGTGDSKFGEIWYTDGEYHMRSKADTYLVMYAPGNDYKTANATVKVTARSVNGAVPSAGFGLIVNGEQSKTKGLQDYALLIYPGDEAAYEIITHKDGGQTALIAKTPSKIIRSGSNPNELEVRIKGNELSFYANGQYLTRITDSANLKNGLAGFYTSDTAEVAFDNLEIRR